MNVRTFITVLAGLTCVALSAGAQTQPVTLQWDVSPEASAAGYVVYVGQASGAYTEQYNVGDRTTFTYTKALPGRPYYFAVSAYGADLQVGPRSEEVLFLSGAAVDASSMLAAPDSTSSSDLDLTGASDSNRASEASASHDRALCAQGSCYEVDHLGSVTGTAGSLTSTGDGRVIFIEDRARVRVIDHDRLVTQPMLEAEGSLQVTTLALGPEFERTGFVYLGVVETASNGNRTMNIVRYREVANVLGEGAVLIAGLPLPATGDALVAVDASRRLYVAIPAASENRPGASRYDAKVLRFEHDGTTVRDDGASAPVFSPGYARPTAFTSNALGDALWLAGTGAEWSGPLALLATQGSQSGVPMSPIAVGMPTGSSVAALGVSRTSPVQVDGRDSMALIDQEGAVFRVVTTRSGVSTHLLIPPSAMGGAAVSALDDNRTGQIYLAIRAEEDATPVATRILRLRVQ